MHRFLDCFKNNTMRILLLLFTFFIFSGCFAQSLRDSLFGGKLKVDSALLIQSKVNMKKAEVDSIQKKQTDSLKKTGDDSLQKLITPEKPVLNYSDNAKIWKKFIDQYTATINTELLTSKKIKKGYYSVMIQYEIGIDGIVTTKTITCTPSNETIVELITEQMMPNAPQLAPLVRDGVPRTSARRQMINLVKEKN